MENETSRSSTTETNPPGQDVTGQTVEVKSATVNNVNATKASITMALTKTVNAQEVVVRQGAMLNGRTDQLNITQGGGALLQSRDAHMTASGFGAVVLGGDAALDQSISRVLVSGGNIKMDQSLGGAVVANNVTAENSLAVFLIARNVNGDVKAAFGQRESILFGAAAGLVAGVVMLLGGLFRRRHPKP